MQYELLIGNIDLLKESGCCADESKLLFSAGVLNDSPVRKMEDKMRIHRLVRIGVIILTPMGIPRPHIVDAATSATASLQT